MLKVSLIIATLGQRPFELCALLRSLAPQVEFIQEVIIVDQHPDPNRIPAQIAWFIDSLPIVHVRSEQGLSRARNRGLAFATGDLVAFPDDDCTYTEGLLESVVDWFETNHEYDFLSVGARDADGVMSGNRWVQNACDIKPLNAFRTTFSSTLFICADLAKMQLFDEQLGVGSGTSFGSGEETDYVLRLLRTGARGRFDRSHHIIHPCRDMLSEATSAPRAMSYGFGTGHVLRLHSLTTLWLGFMGYNIVRAGIAALRGRLTGAHLCLAQALGFARGFLTDHASGRQPILISSISKERKLALKNLGCLHLSAPEDATPWGLRGNSDSASVVIESDLEAVGSHAGSNGD